MSIYQYQAPSAIEKIHLQKSAGGGARCFLFARDDISQTQAAQIRTQLDKAHLSCVATEVDGRNCLEVRGCKNITVLEDALRPADAITGKGIRDDSDQPKFSLKERFSNNMVALYGAINVVADMGIIAYGHMKQKLSPSNSDWEDKAAGYAYSAGSVLFTLFGRGDKSDYQARDIATALRKELQDKGIELAHDSAAVSFSTAGQRQGMARNVTGYLSKHGAEVGNIATGTAGFFMFKGAQKSGQSYTRAMDSILGATTMLSGYGAALISEKTPDTDHPPTTTFGKIKQWVQERPNRLAGYGYMASTVIHGTETVRHYARAETEHPENVQLAKRAYGMRGAFSTLNLIGEFILTRASKGHGAGVRGSATIEDTALSIVADAIIRQPQDKRDVLVQQLGRTFLANPDVLGGDPAALEAKLYERVHKLENNPWAVKNAGASKPAISDDATKDQRWAERKVQKLVSDAAKAKPENYVAALDKSRAAVAERVP